jgi:hypothetical protein
MSLSLVAWCSSLPYEQAIRFARNEEIKDRLIKRKLLFESCGKYRGRIPVWKDEVE